METGLNFEINILSLNRGSAAESMFRKCAIEKYVLPNAGIRKMISVDAPISVQQCFRQMKRNQLDEIAAFLLEETDSNCVWPGLFTSKPTITALRKLNKDGLVERMAPVFVSSLKEVLLLQSIEDVELLLELAEKNTPFIVSYYAGDKDSIETAEAQYELILKYGNLLDCGLLACRAVVSSDNIVLGYQLLLPEEVFSLLREDGMQILLMKCLSDLIDCYAAAAVNLYGVITIRDFKKIIHHYEREIAKTGRTGGGNAYIDFFAEHATADDAMQQEEFRKAAAMLLVDADIEHVVYFLNIADKSAYGSSGYFLEEHESEYSNVKDYGLCVVNDEFLIENDEGDWRSYTPILVNQESHIRYFPPSYTEFMAYVDPEYLDPLPAAEKLVEKLCKKHRKELLEGIVATADFFERKKSEPIYIRRLFSNDQTEAVQQAAEEIVQQIRLNIRSSSGQSAVQDVINILQEYRISLKDDKEVNEYLSLAIELNNSGRLWAIKGNIPNEIRSREQLSPQSPLKIVFGPNIQGTNIPAEIQKAIESGKFQGRITVDADEVERASQARKIGRNDPCPCGSGKKYKNCCGRDS